MVLSPQEKCIRPITLISSSAPQSVSLCLDILRYSEAFEDFQNITLVRKLERLDLEPGICGSHDNRQANPEH